MILKRLKPWRFNWKQSIDNGVVVLALDIKGKPQIMVKLSDAAVARGLSAGQMVRTLASHIKGGGGGQAAFATAGGKDVKGLESAIAAVQSLVLETVTN